MGAAHKSPGCKEHTQPETRKDYVAAVGAGEEGVTPSVSEEEGGDHDVASSGPQP